MIRLNYFLKWSVSWRTYIEKKHIHYKNSFEISFYRLFWNKLFPSRFLNESSTSSLSAKDNHLGKNALFLICEWSLYLLFLFCIFSFIFRLKVTFLDVKHSVKWHAFKKPSNLHISFCPFSFKTKNSTKIEYYLISIDVLRA